MHCLKLPRRILLAVFIFLFGCATSPTGRDQLIIFSDSEMSTLGSESFNQLKAKQTIEKSAAINTYVKCVAMEVLKESKGYSQPADWEVVVFKDDSANAFALPGGKIGVHTGLLKVAKNQDQLAAVLGHEVGHVLARHSNERVSEAFAAQGFLVALNVVTKDNPNQGLIMALMGVGAQFGFLLPHSRNQETEADVIGLEIMARAGFNPQEAVELWRNMSAQGGTPPELLSTHPSPSSRIANLQSRQPQAQKWFTEAKTTGHNPNCSKP